MSRRNTLPSVVASEIRQRARAGVTLVAVDGIDGAGKTCFADELAQHLTDVEVIRASVDGFHHPKSIRYAKGRRSPEGYYLDSYDYELLKAELLDPLRSGGTHRYRTAVFDHRTDSRVEMPVRLATPPAVLLFDGIFLHRPELADYWDYSIFLQVDQRESLRRCNERDGASGLSDDPRDPHHLRYVRGQEIYLSACNPSALASIVINNDRFDEPYIVGTRGVLSDAQTSQ
jgi:uridine kinase